MIIEVLDINFDYNGVLQVIHPVIIQDDNNMILIDAGYPCQFNLFEQEAKKKDLNLNKLSHIIITHHDFDHIGSLADFKKKYPYIKILSSNVEKAYIEKRRKPLRLEQAEKRYSSLSDDEKKQAITFHNILESIERVEVTDILSNHQILAISQGVEVIFTPGHTEGHISLYIKETKTLIAGDALVLVDDRLIIPYPEFAYDLSQAQSSVKSLFHYQIEEVICYHGGIYKGNWQDILILDNW
ncbi:MBL fold metallo-hydrolase [Gilliamella sp. B2776]|uniref:MBL fold metallo-hydrolase n=1 Tax=unclassified Gilliamella TaxID=2685620 RepID=UPI00226A5EB8|nr:MULTISPECIES: MBL fold metallo-hydrolase [unclassified Gilliamella]MCX8649385.1 MBL fold metallo-hydrolase [Gilliamella sp. B2779]MCX8654754.1 MBL fold metallo-hydrolase [Gilliamella sp. B2737]MCX8655774.1 MBL fold metallo-hydrolase [Gilliamella sp. B2894]MCX8663876.1 MBL fold metallo-hydrolase [Gilliamella sp. B2887]MCX8691120.1 MBL fold metallo-hydrolase [Gilliamella sp. B2776]